MRQIIVGLALVAAPLAPAHAQTMTVATFLGKAEALMKKGPMALFSSDVGKLKAEIGNSAKQLRIERTAAEKAGRKPSTCIPSKISLSSSEVLDHFRAIPPAERNMPVKTAFAGLVRKKHPCPA